MLRVQIAAALSLFVLLLAQDDDNSKKERYTEHNLVQ